MIFDGAFFGVLLRAVFLTLALFFLLLIGLQYGLHYVPPLPVHGMNAAINILASILLVAVFVFLGAPVTAFFAALFLDGIARDVEKKYYPADAPSSGAPFWGSVLTGLRLTGMVIVVTLALLPVDITLPGVGSGATILADGWLLGREFFELVALRHMSKGAAETLRKRHTFAIYGAGIVIALLSEIPVVNFIAPLFGTAFMVHVFKRLQREDRPV